jgi:hypothetical protein
VALASDTGPSNSDGITNSTSLNLGGTLLADGTRYFSVDGGDFTNTYTAPTSQGSHTVSIKQIDSAGNSGQISSLTFNLDTLAPTLSSTVPSTSLSTVAGTAGNSVGETITLTLNFDGPVNGLTSGNDNTIFKVGNTLMSATWGGTNGTSTRNLTYTVVAGQNGKATIDEVALKTALIEGVSDTAGNAFSYNANGGVIADIDSTALPVIDTTAPNNTVSGVQLSADTGSSASDFITGTASQTIRATLNAALLTGDILEGSVDGGTTWTVITNMVSGTAITWTGATLSGSSSMVFRVTDQAGNVGANIGTTSYVLDTTAPTAIDLNKSVAGIQSSQTSYINSSALGASGFYSIGTDFASFTETDIDQVKIVLSSPNYNYTGLSNGDWVIGSSSDYSLSTQAGTMSNVPVNVKYTVSNRTLIMSPSGSSSFTAAQVLDVLSALKMANTPQTITEGTYTFTFTTLDRAGNESASATQAVVIDVTAPSAPSLSLANDIGNFNNDALTSDPTINVSGLEANASWQYKVDSGSWVTGSGTSFAATAGSHTYAVRQADMSGNVGATSSTLTVDYDATVPTVSGVAITSAAGIQNNILNIGDVVSVTVTMSEATTVTGTPTVGLNIGGTTVQASYVSGSGTTALVFKYTILAGLSDANGISVDLNSLALAGGTLKDAAGNNATLTHSALTDNASYKVEAVAPTLSSTAPSISMTGSSLNAALPVTKGNSLNETITLTLNFDGPVNGLTSGSDSSIFKVAGTGVAANWAGTADTSTRTLTYTVALGQNGKATIDEAALKAALIEGISDAVGNAFSYTANGGVIADIDSNALPVIDATAPDVVDLSVAADIQNTSSDTVSSSEASAGKSIASHVQAPAATDISVIQLVIGGANFDKWADKLVFNGAEQSLNTLAGSKSNFQLGGVAVSYSFLGETNTFLITKSGGGTFDPDTLDDIVKAILFKTTSTSQGDRTITLRYIDTAGNAGDPAVQTLKVDYSSTTPLVLDLNGDGVRTTDVSQGVLFDVNDTGSPVMTGWVDAHDGLLVLDLNGDGLIQNGAELFGSGTQIGNGKAIDGYAALSQYDLNADGVINAQDTVFKDLQVWQDRNTNGVNEAGELHSLASLGIASLDLNALQGTQMDHGNTLGLVSGWTDTLGQTHQMADVWFSTTSLMDLVSQASLGQLVDLAADSAANTVDLTLAQVLPTEQKLVVVKADANDEVRIDQAGWVNTGSTKVVDNHSYALWSHSAAHLLIDQNAKVHAVL